MKQETKQTPSPSKEKIFELVAEVYEQKGQLSAMDEAYKYDIVKEEYCNPCETESPSIDHTCLICGSSTTPLPSIHEEGKFTKGDWIARRQNPKIYPFEIVAKSKVNIIVASIWGKPNQEEAEANAALIAQSKNMYLALKDLLDDPYISDAMSQPTYNAVKEILNRVTKD